MCDIYWKNDSLNHRNIPSLASLFVSKWSINRHYLSSAMRAILLIFMHVHLIERVLGFSTRVAADKLVLVLIYSILRTRPLVSSFQYRKANRYRFDSGLFQAASPPSAEGRQLAGPQSPGPRERTCSEAPPRAVQRPSQQCSAVSLSWRADLTLLTFPWIARMHGWPLGVRFPAS